MPKVSVKKKEYMVLDLPHWLVKEARKKGMHQKDLAAALDITPQAFHQRMLKDGAGRPKDAFSYGELLVLFELLDVSEEEKVRLLTL